MPKGATHVLDALGDPTRRAVLRIVATGPHAVGAIAAQLPVSRPAVSKHLRVLESAELVVGVDAGRQRIYRLAPEGFAALRAWVNGMWDDALTALDHHVTAAATHPEEPS